MTSILWLRFADDSGLPEKLTREDQDNLAAIFSAAPDSLWSRNLSAMGLKPYAGPMVLFHQESPYINWTAMTAVITGGMAIPVPAETGFSYKTAFSLSAFFAFIANQWKFSSHLQKTLHAPLPEQDDDKIIESLSLGMVLVSLTPRLPKHSPAELSLWLADPAQAPAQARKTLQQIQALQMRRTALSDGWKKYITGKPGAASDLPPYFWDLPPEHKPVKETAASSIETSWKGIPVVKGEKKGQALVIHHKSPEDMEDASLLQGRILVFPRARPETVMFFEHAAAVLYAEGGTLSHACTVAREQKITCITALGASFLSSVKDGDMLEINGADGTVRICK